MKGHVHQGKQHIRGYFFNSIFKQSPRIEDSETAKIEFGQNFNSMEFIFAEKPTPVKVQTNELKVENFGKGLNFTAFLLVKKYFNYMNPDKSLGMSIP